MTATPPGPTLTVSYTVDVYADVQDGKVTAVRTGNDIKPTGEVHRSGELVRGPLALSALDAADAAEWPVWDE